MFNQFLDLVYLQTSYETFLHSEEKCTKRILFYFILFSKITKLLLISVHTFEKKSIFIL